MRAKIVTKDGKLIQYQERDNVSPIQLNGRYYAFDGWVPKTISEDGKEYYQFRDATDEKWFVKP